MSQRGSVARTCEYCGAGFVTWPYLGKIGGSPNGAASIAPRWQ